ncbi:hypothetical protein [Microbacterium sp. RU33B]|uniref:hypothetical protein n=1 Tax=Microbacterium sp. RU33B TaxID=1907390 RepID=UPI0009670148|nr:hypothetical protein [Microbacterium sp. RU33B]SIT88167.1 hypothetical protein SAMN05880545_2947 [Microbacterium sp. RU33B]
MNRRITALTLAAVALFGLTACTAPTVSPTTSTSAGAGTDGGSSGDGQTVAEACALVQQTITEATSEFESAASADPASVVEAMRNAADSIAGAASQVSNDEVAALLPSLQEMFGKTSEIMQALVDGDVSKLGEMAEIGQSFQETTETFQELCAG